MGYRPLSKLCRHLRGDSRYWPSSADSMDISFNVKVKGKENPVKVTIVWDEKEGEYKSTTILPNTKYTDAVQCNSLVLGEDMNGGEGQKKGGESFVEVASTVREAASGTTGWGDVEGECNGNSAGELFKGMSSDCKSTEPITFDCTSHPELCGCLVSLKEKVTFQRRDSEDSLTFSKEGDSVEYELSPSCSGQMGSRRRLLNVYGKGTS